MAYTDEIKDFLQKNEYQVIVSSEGENSDILNITIPQRKIEPVIEEINISYRCCYSDKESGIYYVVSSSEEDFIKCSPFCIQEFIELDISRICERIEYDSSLVCFKLSGKTVSEKEFKDSFFKYQLTEKEQKIIFILRLIIKSIEHNGEFPLKTDYNEEEYESAYNNAKSFFGI